MLCILAVSHNAPFFAAHILPSLLVAVLLPCSLSLLPLPGQSDSAVGRLRHCACDLGPFIVEVPLLGLQNVSIVFKF